MFTFMLNNQPHTSRIIDSPITVKSNDTEFFFFFLFVVLSIWFLGICRFKKRGYLTNCDININKMKKIPSNSHIHIHSPPSYSTKSSKRWPNRHWLFKLLVLTYLLSYLGLSFREEHRPPTTVLVPCPSKRKKNYRQIVWTMTNSSYPY